VGVQMMARRNQPFCGWRPNSSRRCPGPIVIRPASREREALI
jgi:hypothetical protein